jgi:hypothetical protein
VHPESIVAPLTSAAPFIFEICMALLSTTQYEGVAVGTSKVYWVAELISIDWVTSKLEVSAVVKYPETHPTTRVF